MNVINKCIANSIPCCLATRDIILLKANCTKANSCCCTVFTATDSYGAAPGPQSSRQKIVWKYSIKLAELRRSVVFFLEITLCLAKYLQAYVHFQF